MFTPNATWTRISAEFTEDEQADLIVAIAGESTCPPGLNLLAAEMPRPLIEKLRSAMARVDTGA